MVEVVVVAVVAVDGPGLGFSNKSSSKASCKLATAGVVLGLDSAALAGFLRRGLKKLFILDKYIHKLQ